jgi:ribosomal protein S18 acetylase RimI-like enzyme
MRIRAAGIDDSQKIALLFDAYRQFYGQPADLALARRFIDARLSQGESVALLAEDESGEPLGFCQMYPTFCSVEAAAIYVLYDLFVSPDRRRHGVGRALMQAAEARAHVDGVARIDLATAKTNATAQSLYESMGWCRDEQFHTYSKRVRPPGSPPPKAHPLIRQDDI